MRGAYGKMSNFGRAMYDMFGVGKDPEEGERVDGGEMSAGGVQSAGEAHDMEESAGYSMPVRHEEPASEPVEEFRVERTVPVHTYEGTYLAAGAIMQGTLTVRGDVEIAGDFDGEIIAKGKVTVHSNINSRITAMGLSLVGCNLVGDVEVSGDVVVDSQSTITGNVRAESMVCSGRIKGDLDIQDNLVLDDSAQIDGNITVDAMSMARGAKISGTVEMRNIQKK